MRVLTIDERFARFLNRPAQDRWLAVREQLVAHPDFDPYSPLWRLVEDEFAAGAYAQVLQLAEGLGPLGCLSPRFHYWLGVSALETGDFPRAAAERESSRVCLEALLDSGQGTAAAPYLSTYPWDSYDVLRCLEVEPRGQQLVESEGRWCDVMLGDDGQKYWFDVSDLLTRPQRSATLSHIVG
jgi:hypothetical protein